MLTKTANFINKVYTSLPNTKFALDIGIDETMCINYDTIEVSKDGVKQIKRGNPVDFKTFGLEPIDLHELKPDDILDILDEVNASMEEQLSLTFVPFGHEGTPMYCITFHSQNDRDRQMSLFIYKYEPVKLNDINTFAKYEV